jgi:hypothetical protein
MGAEDVLLPTKKELASTSGTISVGRERRLLLDTNPYPLNAVSQISKHRQEAIFARAEPDLRRALVRTFNTLGSWRSGIKTPQDGKAAARGKVIRNTVESSSK